MARFRKIPGHIWLKADLSFDARSLFAFIATHGDINNFGILRSSVGALAFETQRVFSDSPPAVWAEAAASVTQALHSLTQVGWIALERDKPVIFVRDFVAFNPPQSVNVVKSWRADFDALPDCRLRRDAIIRAGKFLKGLPPSYLRGFYDSFSDRPDILAAIDALEQQMLPLAKNAGQRDCRPPKPQPLFTTCAKDESFIQPGNGRAINLEIIRANNAERGNFSIYFISDRLADAPDVSRETRSDFAANANIKHANGGNNVSRETNPDAVGMLGEKKVSLTNFNVNFNEECPVLSETARGKSGALANVSRETRINSDGLGAAVAPDVSRETQSFPAGIRNEEYVSRETQINSDSFCVMPNVSRETRINSDGLGAAVAPEADPPATGGLAPVPATPNPRPGEKPEAAPARELEQQGQGWEQPPCQGEYPAPELANQQGEGLAQGHGEALRQGVDPINLNINNIKLKDGWMDGWPPNEDGRMDGPQKRTDGWMAPINFYCLDGRYAISDAEIESFANLYPELDIHSELRSVASWLECHEKRPKLARIKGYIRTSLENRKARSQERSKPGAPRAAQASKRGGKPQKSSVILAKFFKSMEVDHANSNQRLQPESGQGGKACAGA